VVVVVVVDGMYGYTYIEQISHFRVNKMWANIAKMDTICDTFIQYQLLAISSSLCLDVRKNSHLLFLVLLFF
jgi:hypothetical protein